ncbi:hypothetical protein GS910_38635 [Paraburkholderia sp. RL16-012-BIC-B]|nr:hypothetical protein [Paraburkholderia madseniana]
MVTGCVGLEANGKTGLLRSLAVNPAALNAGIGRILVSNLEEAVALQKIDQSYQLTTTGVCAVPTFERRTWLPAGGHGAWKATHPAS